MEIILSVLKYIGLFIGGSILFTGICIFVFAAIFITCLFWYFVYGEMKNTREMNKIK